MYTIEEISSEQFHRLLSISETDWITVVGTKAGVLFAVDTNEILAVLQYNTIRSEMDKDFAIRVQKNLLQPILTTGRLEIECAENTVTMAVATVTEEDFEKRCSIQMPRHKAFITTLTQRLKILKPGDCFNAGDLGKIALLAKRFKTFVSCTGEYASIELRDGTCIVCKITTPEFALTYNAMDALFRCSTKWQCMGTNVYAIDGNFGVLVTQCRSSNICMTNYFEADDAGASMVFTCDYSDVITLLQRYKECELSIDLDTNMAILTNADICVRTTMFVKNLQRSEKYKENKVVVSASVVRDILPKLSPAEVTVKVKRYFNQIESGAFTILCK